MNAADGSGPNGRIANSYGKFFVGALAGLCAALLPRLLALLAQTDDANVTILPIPYLVASGVFALLMGSLVVIFEWKMAVTPRDTFVGALGIPAVIAGALGTSSGLGNGADAKRELDQVLQGIRQHEGIIKQGAFTTVQPLDLSGSTSQKSGAWTLPSPVGTVYAQQFSAQVAQDASPRFGIYYEQPKYVIVLRQVKSEKEAIIAAQELKRRLPRVQAAKADNGYYVLLGGADGRNEPDALLEASRAKAVLGDIKIQPQLVQLKR